MKNSLSPVVSIIITSYNYGMFLSQAIDSILRQTITNVQIIIVDDCSTDNSIDIIKKYKNKYSSKIDVVFHQSNKGLKKSLEDGLLLAKGTFIAFCESDDLFFPDCLERKITILQNDEKVKLVYSDIQSIGEKLSSQMTDYLKGVRFFGKHFFQPKGNYDFSAFKFNPSATLTNIVFRKKDIKDFSFNKEFELWCDLQLLVYLSLLGKFAFIPEKLIAWRYHEKSLNFKLKKTKEFHLFTQKFNTYYYNKTYPLAFSQKVYLILFKIYFGIFTPKILFRKFKKSLYFLLH